MTYLLRHEDNDLFEIPDDFQLLDCAISMLNHFEEGKYISNTYVIDLACFDETDLIILGSMIKQIREIEPGGVIYVIGGDIDLPNARSIESIADIP
jgi:hypothetical protein